MNKRTVMIILREKINSLRGDIEDNAFCWEYKKGMFEEKIDMMLHLIDLLENEDDF